MLKKRKKGDFWSEEISNEFIRDLEKKISECKFKKTAFAEIGKIYDLSPNSVELMFRAYKK